MATPKAEPEKTLTPEELEAKIKADEAAKLREDLEAQIRADVETKVREEMKAEQEKVLAEMKADLALDETDKIRIYLEDIPKKKFKADKVYATYYPNGFLDIYNGINIQFQFDGSEIEMYEPIVDYVKTKIDAVVALEVEKSQKTLSSTVTNVIANINLD